MLAEDGGLPTSNSCAKSFWRRARVADFMLVYGLCLCWGGLKWIGTIAFIAWFFLEGFVDICKVS